jgi:FAD/FMN-containing dehydrogenase
VCTVGGNVAHNSGGPHTLKYGVTVNHVLGLQMVLTDGSIVEIGGPERAGYDLLGIITGSEGTFGIVTRITVRLAAPTRRGAHDARGLPFDPGGGAGGRRHRGRGDRPRGARDDGRRRRRGVARGVRPHVPRRARARSCSRRPTARRGDRGGAARIESVCRACGALEVRVARDAEERARSWTARKKTFGALGRLAPNYYTQDGVIPRTRLGRDARARARDRREAWPDDRERLPRRGREPASVHPLRRQEARARARVLAAGEELLRACVALGGSLTGEHGIGMEKRDRMPLMFTEADLAAMRTLRAVFDPAGLCNPGKIFPGGRAVVHGAGARVPTGRDVSGPATPVAAWSAARCSSAAWARRRSCVRAPRRRSPRSSRAPAGPDPPSSRGATARGSALSASAREAGIVLSTERLGRIVEYEPADLTVTVEAGCTLAELDRVCRSADRSAAPARAARAGRSAASSRRRRRRDGARASAVCATG